MKKILTVSILLLLSVSGLGQVADTMKYSVSNDLLQKSKRQKTTAFVMLGAGAVATVTGAIIFDQNFDLWDDSNDALMGTGLVLGTAGVLSMLGSIPFFIASSKNKNRAIGMKAGIKLDRIIPDGVYKVNTTYYPTVTLTFNIR
jgi:hypothetical protein